MLALIGHGLNNTEIAGTAPPVDEHGEVARHATCWPRPAAATGCRRRSSPSGPGSPDADPGAVSVALARHAYAGRMSEDLKPTYVEQGKAFDRDMDYIPDRITRDARTPEHGPADVELWPVEPGRYRLVAAPACPWANRAIIVRHLLGLEDVISLGLPRPDPRRAQLDLRPRPRRRRPGARHRAAAGGLLRPLPRLPARHHRAGDGRGRDRPGRHQRLPVDHPRPLLRVARPPPPGRAGPVAGRRAARRWRR